MFVATQPQKMRRHPYPQGPDRDGLVQYPAQRCEHMDTTAHAFVLGSVQHASSGFGYELERQEREDISIVGCV